MNINNAVELICPFRPLFECQISKQRTPPTCEADKCMAWKPKCTNPNNVSLTKTYSDNKGYCKLIER
jgi:hypothetical protein